MEAFTLQLTAPLSGVVIPLGNVPDPVFSQKLVGDGIGIDPIDSILYAPCAGKIIQLHSASHAISIGTDNGAQILLHIGLDTVALKGQGFKPRVKLGDQVQQGQPLIEFDSDLIAEKATSLISVMIITEAPPHALVESPIATVKAGQDILLTLRPQGSEKGPAVESAVHPAAGKKVESSPISVQLASGLHARPAAQLVALAKKFQAKIEATKGDASANAKSLVSLLGLEIGFGDQVRFVAEGDDAATAVAELSGFLRDFVEEAHHAAPPAPKPVPARSGSAKVITGVRASPGRAIGHVHQLKTEDFDIPEKGESIAAERSKLDRALTAADADLKDLREQVKAQTDASQAAIFAAHQELLTDPDLIRLATDFVEQGKSAAFAWNQATVTHAERLANLNNELMANRASDLRDIGRRVLRILLNLPPTQSAQLESETILIAANLTPSDTVQLDRGKIIAFATVAGGATSHVAILARSLGLPALAGVEDRALQIPEGTEVILDGDSGEIRLDPTEAEKQSVRALQQQQSQERDVAMQSTMKPAITQDGQQIEVGANIGGVADALKAVEMGCDGIGLLRSEFLFLERATAPSEEEQYRFYQDIADILGPRTLVIRTLDVGGDKPLRYMPIATEENPFLGLRGLRASFLRPEILREQLRAILRVKTKGTLHVMFPMVALLEEFRAAKAMLEEERVRLGVPPVKVGVMIEVPSAALIAETLAPEVDFFSIGTNDLTQYVLAMDRGHKDLAKKVDGLHPSVLKLIDITAQAARRHGKWVGVCGGLAGDAQAVPLLLGLGVDELSVSVPSIPLIKSQVRSINIKNSQVLAQRAMGMSNAKDVRDLSTRN